MMHHWILAALALYLAGIYLCSALLLPGYGISAYLGSRDSEPAPAPVLARARRASRNFQENLPVFLALALLAMILPEAEMGQALLGAQIFVLARVAYLPLYLAAVPVLRSAVFTVGFGGLVLMALAVL